MTLLKYVKRSTGCQMVSHNSTAAWELRVKRGFNYKGHQETLEKNTNILCCDPD